MGSFSNMLMRFAKKQAKKAWKDLTKPAPKPKAERSYTPETVIDFELGNNVFVKRNGREYFDGEIIAERDELDMYLAEGWCGESTYLLLCTSTEVIVRKKYDSMSEIACITPNGIGVVADGETIVVLSQDKGSTRSFDYYSGSDDSERILNDEVFAFITEGEDTVTLKCFRVNDQTTWSRKMKYNPDNYVDDLRYPCLTLNDGVFTVMLPDGTPRKYTIEGTKVQ